MRIAFALEARVRAGESQRDAASWIAERLPLIEQASRLMTAKDTRFTPIQFTIGHTKRGNRIHRLSTKAGREDLFRLSETIRVTALTYKTERKDFAREFEGWFGAYRMAYARTQEWLHSQEQPYRDWLQAADTMLGKNLDREPEFADYDVMTISLTGSLAELLHDLGKFDEARKYYQLAIARLRDSAAMMLPGYRYTTLAQLARELMDCWENLPRTQFQNVGGQFGSTDSPLTAASRQISR
jgi:hypothetical protein